MKAISINVLALVCCLTSLAGSTSAQRNVVPVKLEVDNRQIDQPFRVIIRAGDMTVEALRCENSFIFTLLPIGGGIVSNLYFGRNFEPTILLIGFPVSYLLGILIALLYWERQKKHKNSSPRVSD